MNSSTTERLAIVTCSYGPDAQRCHRLCESVDRFVPETVEHCLIVPQRDSHLFSGLQNARRRICLVEDIVPGRFRRAPLSKKWWLSNRGWPVRGWIMQQVTKLSADCATDAELLLFADSDIQFIRPFDHCLVQQREQLRLHRIPGARQDGIHLRWHQRAAELLGLESHYLGNDYVGQLISWRRDNLIALKTHLEREHGRPWYALVAGSIHFSEYILYGAFAEHILGEKDNGHFYCTDDICHCCWFAADTTQLDSGAASVSKRAQALLLQSNLGLSLEQEAQLLRAAQIQITTPHPTGA